MIITKKIDRRRLAKALNSMYYYVVTLIVDSETHEITIVDDESSIRLKTEN